VTYKEKYREILIGFEKFSFTEEQLKNGEGMLDHVLADRRACEKCDGENCLTSVNDPYSQVQWRGYQGLCVKSAHIYGRPVEIVYPCPGPDVRKRQILDAMTAPQSVLAGGQQWEGN